jgi:hypothetical protein
MRPLEGRGLPLVVVLSLIEGSRVMLDAAMTLSAMYGDLIREPSAQTDDGASGRWYYGRSGKLRKQHPYISAVAILRRRTAFSEALIELFSSEPESASRADAVAAVKRFEEERQAGRSPVQENQEFGTWTSTRRPTPPQTPGGHP